jgi:hypothetical protein
MYMKCMQIVGSSSRQQQCRGLVDECNRQRQKNKKKYERDVNVHYGSTGCTDHLLPAATHTHSLTHSLAPSRLLPSRLSDSPGLSPILSVALETSVTCCAAVLLCCCAAVVSCACLLSFRLSLSWIRRSLTKRTMGDSHSSFDLVHALLSLYCLVACLVNHIDGE